MTRGVEPKQQAAQAMIDNPAQIHNLKTKFKSIQHLSLSPQFSICLTSLSCFACIAGYGNERTADEHGMLPRTYEWDMISDKGELAKGGWAGQLLYINRDKDVVVAWFGTNQVADPKVEPLPCRIIAKTFF